MKQTHHSYCRNCTSVCGLLIDVEDNKVTDIRGDASHPLTAGYFCIKGQASMDLHNGEEWLVTSMARRPDGSQKPIDVEQAMDEIHGKLSAIIAEHGPEAVAIYYGTGANNNAIGHSAMRGWLRQIGSPYLFSSMTVDQSAKWVTMGRMGFFVTGKHNALDADVLMEFGANPAVSHYSLTLPMTAPMKWLRGARKRGLKLIVVDPRRTETARLADIHLPIKPGEDATLFAGMIRLVLERGWQDQSFCDRFVAPLDALRAAVDPFTLDYVAERTDIDAPLIEQATETFACARRKSAGSGTGPNMSVASNLSEHLLEAFNAICGGYRRAGDIVHNGGALFGRGVKQEALVPPHRYWENGPKLKTADVGPSFGEYPTPLLPGELIGKDGKRIRALVVVGGNLLKAIPDPDMSIAAFRNLDLLVTLDPRPTETAMMSDYVIATSLPYERLDFTGLFDGYFVKNFAQVAKPLLDPPPGVIEDWEFFWGMARRAGMPLELKQPAFGYSHDDIPGPALKLNLDEKPSTEEIIRWMVSNGKVSFDQLLASPSGVTFEDETIIAPAGEDDGARLDPCPYDVAAELAAVRAQSNDVPGFPFKLIVRRQLESMNSAYSNASKTRKRYPVNPAFMHPEDMDDLGIKDGTSVRITSDNGTIVTRARKDAMLRRGVVSMTHGWGAADASDPAGQAGAFVGRLISLERDLQTINYMPRLSAIPVAIQRDSA